MLIKSPEVVSPENEQEGLTIIEAKGKRNPLIRPYECMCITTVRPYICIVQPFECIVNTFI